MLMQNHSNTDRDILKNQLTCSELFPLDAPYPSKQINDSDNDFSCISLGEDSDDQKINTPRFGDTKDQECFQEEVYQQEIVSELPKSFKIKLISIIEQTQQKTLDTLKHNSIINDEKHQSTQDLVEQYQEEKALNDELIDSELCNMSDRYIDTSIPVNIDLSNCYLNQWEWNPFQDKKVIQDTVDKSPIAKFLKNAETTTQPKLICPKNFNEISFSDENQSMKMVIKNNDLVKSDLKKMK